MGSSSNHKNYQYSHCKVDVSNIDPLEQRILEELTKQSKYPLKSKNPSINMHYQEMSKNGVKNSGNEIRTISSAATVGSFDETRLVFGPGKDTLRRMSENSDSSRDLPKQMENRDMENKNNSNNI